MPMYEASSRYGCEFDPLALLKRHMKWIGAKTEKQKRFDSRTGLPIDDEEVITKPAILVITIAGKTFKYDNITSSDLEDLTDDALDEVFDHIAKKVDAVYCRTGEICWSDGSSDQMFHYFALKGDNRDLAWAARTAFPALTKMKKKLLKLGIVVGKPRIILAADKV